MKQKQKIKRCTIIMRRIFVLFSFPPRLMVWGRRRVCSTMMEQHTLSRRGIMKPTVSMKMTTLDRWDFHCLEEKFSKQKVASVLLFSLEVVSNMNPVGRLPESTSTHTAIHTILALRLVLSPLERKGYTMAKKRSTLMQVRKSMLPYMLV